jgi:hypothetical protein
MAFDGTAKPTPAKAPVGENIAVVIPTLHLA